MATLWLAMLVAGGMQDVLQLPHAFSQGSVLDLEVTKTQETWIQQGRDPATQEPRWQRTRQDERKLGVRLEVVARRPDGFHIDWTYSAHDTGGAMGPVAQMMDGMSLQLVTDRRGFPTGLRNLQAVRVRNRQLWSRVSTQLMEQGTPKAVVQAYGQAARLWFDEGATEDTCLRLPRIVLRVSGGRFRAGFADGGEGKVTHPWIGEDLPSVVGTELLSPLEERVAVIRWTQALDLEQATDLLQQARREQARKAGLPEPPLGELPVADIQDRATYEMDCASGWLVSLEHQRTVQVGAQKTVEGTLVQRK